MPTAEYSGLELKDLRVLDALLREASITRAARVLDTTQPTVSTVLRRLRPRFADPLMVRHGSGVRPTARDRTDSAGPRAARRDGRCPAA